MMRRLIALLIVAAALGWAAVALGAFSQTATVLLTGHTAARSTGVLAEVRSSDPAAPGAKPQPTRQLVMTFPAGTRFDLGTPLLTPCRLTDRQLTTPFGPTCPRRSRIGTGTAVANASPLQQAVPTVLRAYVTGPDRFILEFIPSLPGTTPSVIHATISGSQLTLPIPHLTLGRGDGFAGITAVFVSLTLHVPALGHGGNALIVAGRCTAHRFAVTSRFTYADDSTLTLRSASACR